MKTIKYFLILIAGVLFSCDKYLDKTPSAIVGENDVFSTYQSFQGFLDPNYSEIVDYAQHYLVSTMNYGGDTYSYVTWASGWLGNNGNYTYIAGLNSPSLFNSTSNLLPEQKSNGIWAGGWRGIRVCNIALKKLPLLTDATDEERKLLEGQIYFFRAFFHAEILSGFGGMPFVDSVFNATDELNMPRISYQECTGRIVQDYDKAIALLPVNWDSTTVGKARMGKNTGRITKGAALAYKQKHLLYGASPLMNKFSGGDYTYNVQMSKDAADAGWAFIKELVNEKHEYELTPFANYYDNFSKLDGTMPWTKETILQRVDRRSGSGVYTSNLGRTYGGPGRMGGSENTETVNQLFVDKFEMSDGTRYKQEYDRDDTKRWENRDPRFRKSIIIDRERHGTAAQTVINLYDPNLGDAGSDKTVLGQIALPYVTKKFWRATVNTYDKGWGQLRFVTPRMRLAEVYLDYAEAVTAAYGATGSAPGGITAVEAINIVRARAGMPPVTAAADGYANFMDLVRNERNVELCFEGHYWFDIRRWYIAHLPENKQIMDLRFNKAWTPESFTRVLFFTRIFDDPKHYWLPLPRNMTLLYPEMYQNPGWD